MGLTSVTICKAIPFKIKHLHQGRRFVDNSKFSASALLPSVFAIAIEERRRLTLRTFNYARQHDGNM
jgi:hypothetical protein